MVIPFVSELPLWNIEEYDEAIEFNKPWNNYTDSACWVLYSRILISFEHLELAEDKLKDDLKYDPNNEEA